MVEFIIEQYDPRIETWEFTYTGFDLEEAREEYDNQRTSVSAKEGWSIRLSVRSTLKEA